MKKTWGKLTPLSITSQKIELENLFNIVGTAENSDIKLESEHIEEKHCSIYFELDEAKAYLSSFVDNQIVVGDKSLEKDEIIHLNNGDMLQLSKSIGSRTNKLCYIFTTQGDFLKRSSGEKDELKRDVSDRKRVKAEERKIEEDEFKCGICLETVYNCVSLMPCLHNFCGSCVTNWIKRKQSCPFCKSKVMMARKNAKINSLVEKYCKREITPGEKKKLDDKDFFKKNTQMNLDALYRKKGGSSRSHFGSINRTADTRNRDNSSSSSGSYSPSRRTRPQIRPFAPHMFIGNRRTQDDGLRCKECDTIRQGEDYQCDADTEHIQCVSCQNLMPDRTITQDQRCAICARAYCFLYFNTQCEGRVTLRKLKDFPVKNRISSTIFKGNTHEMENLRGILETRNQQPRDIYEHCMDTYVKLGNYEYVKDRTLFMNAFPPIKLNLSEETLVCSTCFEDIWFLFCYRYFQDYKDDLPIREQARVDCWYGINCRTTIHNLIHSQKFNHVCPQTNF